MTDPLPLGGSFGSDVLYTYRFGQILTTYESAPLMLIAGLDIIQTSIKLSPSPFDPKVLPDEAKAYSIVDLAIARTAASYQLSLRRLLG